MKKDDEIENKDITNGEFAKELTKLADDLVDFSLYIYKNKGFITDLRKLVNNIEKFNKDIEKIIEFSKDIEKMIIRINMNKDFIEKLTEFNKDIEKAIVRSELDNHRKCMNNLNEAITLIRKTRDMIEGLAYLDGTLEKEGLAR